MGPVLRVSCVNVPPRDRVEMCTVFTGNPASDGSPSRSCSVGISHLLTRYNSSEFMQVIPCLTVTCPET